MNALEIIDVNLVPSTLNKYHRRCRRRRGVVPAPASTGVLSLRVTVVEQKPSATLQIFKQPLQSKNGDDDAMAATFGIAKGTDIFPLDGPAYADCRREG